MQITTEKLIEIMNDRLTGWCKTVDHKLYSLISNKELIDILNDCGVEVKHNQSLDSDGKKPLIGNCPVCKLSIICIGNGKTPRHGHIKSKWGWLPACSGSGKPAIWTV